MAKNENKEKIMIFPWINEEEQDIEAIGYHSDNDSDQCGRDSEGNRRTEPLSSSSQIWPQTYGYINLLLHLYVFSCNFKIMTSMSFLFVLLIKPYDMLCSLFLRYITHRTKALKKNIEPRS